MKHQGKIRTLFGFLLIVFSVLLFTGCGTGASDENNAPPGGTVGNVTTNVTADAGPIVAVKVGETAILDGRYSSSSDGAAKSFAWAFTDIPVGSTVVLQNSATSTPSFVPDLPGTYTVELKVTAAGVTSPRAFGKVVVTTPTDTRPTGPYNHPGLSSNCGLCHNDQYPQNKSKSQDHVATSNQCGACHTPLGFNVITFVDHQDVFGNCSECHNGVNAIGKSEYHVPTTEECSDCHNTTSFLELQPDGSFDHTGIQRVCQGCHNGTVAIGKTADHPDTGTTEDCGFCHTTVSFLPAYVDHSGPVVLGQPCANCHNGTTATGQTPTHPDTGSINCVICHSTVTFDLGGAYDHSRIDSITLPCGNCHNDVNARGKDVGHVDTTSDCANCHNVTGFLPAFFDHTGIVDNCARSGCHDGSGTDGALGKHANHLPTTLDCSVCHTPGTFTTGVFDHTDDTGAAITSGCDTCHDNVIAVGKLITHVPTTAPCENCHTTASFSGAVFDHVDAGIVGNCATCHNGDIALGKPAAHLPTTADCSSCHSTTDFTTFAGITFNHVGIDTNNCLQCHDGVIAKGKESVTLSPGIIKDHIPTLDDCSVCHSGYTSFAGGTFDHTGVTRGCEGCHIERFFDRTLTNRFKLPTHLPTSQDCYLCHTTAAFTPASNFNHTGITGNCESCHDGSFASIGARGKTPSPPHPVTNDDCGACHNTTNFADAYPDHTDPALLAQRCDNCHVDGSATATGKDDAVPPHIPTNEDCRVCHVPGTFANAVFNHQGIVDNCASCHNGTTATGLSAGHISILDSRGQTRDCSDCHNTTAFAGATYDHTGITNNCASCHNGTTATGKNNDHVPTNQDCSVCHQTTGFIPAIFDHVGITGNCASCHNGTFATGKPNGHITTNQDCGVCHNTRTFTGATFDHSTVTATTRCDSCHNGTTAIGKDSAVPPHLQTSLDCRNCHTTATFVGGTWDHQGITGNCVSCHDGNTATGKGNGHFVTTADCNSCHSTNAWTPISFRHTDPDYPGNHNSSVTCLSCHKNNRETITYSSPTYAPFCAGCHERDYRAGDHRGTLADNKDCGRSGCHRVSARSW